MTIEYIGTISRAEWSGSAIKKLLRTLDVDWGIFGRETGKSGYEHWQFAIKTASDLSAWNDRNKLGWHIENCISWEKAVRYCRKDGRYFLFGNPPRSERQYYRYRTRQFRLNEIQSQILRELRHQSDRTIQVWIDRKGGVGKSTIGYLENIGGRWLSVPRTEQSGVKILDFIAMHYDGEKVICVDLPRQKTLTPELCGVLEDIKDGQVYSAKYQGTKLFLRGIKVVVFTNSWVPKKTYESLSKDRWDIHVIGDEQGEYPTR